MDVRNYHPNFNDLVIQGINKIITEYDFSVETGDCSVHLYNDLSILKLGYNEGYLNASFVSPDEKKKKLQVKRSDGWPSSYPHYSTFSVWKFLYPNDNINYSLKGLELLDQIEMERKLLIERLSNVLQGDFTWITAYKEDNARVSKKIEYMSNHWDIDNPVRIKFKNGDSTWEKDFDEYKNYLDKLQRKG